jgi:hypothetical protein
MSQPGATPPPEKPPTRPTRTTQRPAPGVLVKPENGEDKGVVTESDSWWDTFQLPGVSSTAQVLVEWPRGGNPVRQWVRVADLEIVKPEPEDS